MSNKNIKSEAPQRGSWISEFLWSCAGVNREILRMCPTDHAKYAGSGGTILFTALMAILSGGYAMYFVFNSTWIAIAFGVFWGLLIFNLDRYIVNTMYSDGLPTISMAELRAGLPRIIMAIFLGIVISTPLEMKIFSDRIDSQLIMNNIARTNATRAKAAEGVKSLEDRRNLLEQERKDISDRMANAESELLKEAEGSALSGVAGHGQIYKDKERNLNAIKKELDNWDAAHGKELTELKGQISTILSKAQEDINKGNTENGFCVRYEAFADVKNNNLSLQIVSIVIMLLFIIIETAPTFFKMMMSSGPYDDMLRAEMHRVRIESDKQISDINDEINTLVQISTEKNREKLKAELEANKEVINKIALVQAELLQTAIEEWRQEELKKIHENPSAYIKSDNSKS